MENKNTQFGQMEAFSFRKAVVKISGTWIRFEKDTEGAIRMLSVGDKVAYKVENRQLKRIEKQLPKPPAETAQPKEQPAQNTTDTRNRSIERQVALKAAVELAGLYGYGSTKEYLDVAESFADWIENGTMKELPTMANTTATSQVIA
jgi:hypothetical protein